MTAVAIGGFELASPALLLGLVFGLVYGLLAVGLVLVYRSTKVVNFAHAEIGVFAATVMSIALSQWHLPYWVAFPLALALGGAVGAVAEIAVVRRLRRVPRLMSLVVTIGLAQFLLLFGFALVNSVVSASFPDPPGIPSFTVGSFPLRPAFTAIVIFVPLVVVALTIFLRRTRVGLQMRAAADNAERARTSRVYATRMSTLAWFIAGVVSTLVAVFLFPSVTFTASTSLGPTLLLRSLVPAVIARMANLPVALGAGVALGVFEQLLLWNYSSSGAAVELVLFSVVLVALLLQAPRAGREEERGSWALVQAWPPLPEELSEVWAIRNGRRILAVAALIGAVAIAVVSDNAKAVSFTSIAALAVVGLSVGIVTGLSGQLSFGQFALAGIGATASFHAYRQGVPLPLAFLIGGAGAAAAAAVVGIPALRIRGLMLAVTTLAFSVMAGVWLFKQPWMLGTGLLPGRPSVAGYELDTQKKYYFFVLAFLVVALVLANNLRRSGLGRCLVALRDNHDAARAFTVPVTRRKLQAFAAAGFLAGVGGAAYAHGLSVVSSETFPFDVSIDVVAMTVVGGISMLSGPLIGALYIFGLPVFVPLDSAALATSRLGWVLLILYFPGGLAQLLLPLRERVVDRLARRAGVDVATVRARRSPESTRAVADEQLRTSSALARSLPPGRPTVSEGAVLEVSGLTKRYGAVVAVDDVSLQVHAGETLGIIGPNGAGKTTLFELVSGFTRPDAGTVVFEGRTITRRSPEARGRMGLIRSFQDAYLFPTMSILEAVQLAQEGPERSRFWAAVAGRGDGRKAERARDLVNLMGLDHWRHTPIAELSTGTRRIAELACLMAVAPKLLLLDEPSSGIAQPETEALAELLTKVKEHLGATLVIIEHNMPLVMGMSDRVIAMASGRVLCEGRPEQVAAAPEVIEAYLGEAAAVPTG